MRILLTGASGFIGRHLRAALAAEGHQVLCTTRRPGSERTADIPADFAHDTDKSVWLARLSGIDVVINTVGIFRESRGQTFQALHSDAPRALFAACAASESVRLVIQLSALGADDEASSRYHRSKKEADDYLASLPLRAFIVQPSLVYGKDGGSARLFKMLASMPLCLRFGDAPQLVQPIHVDDLVTAIASLVRHPLPVPPSGATAQRLPLVGAKPLPFTDYLAALRRAMGMGKLRVWTLPRPLATLAAKLARHVPGALLDEEALAMLDRGNTASPAITTRLLGHGPRPPAEFITDPAAERTHAKLQWLLPVLRASIAIVWIATAIVSVGPSLEEGYRLLARTGIPAQWQTMLLYAACAFDLLLGLGILLLARRRWLWLLQLGLIGFYSVVIAWKLPEFLLHPYGPLTKNLPMLAAIWLLYELEEK